MATWNKGDFPMRGTDPTGTVLVEDQFQVPDNARTFDIPAGPKGAYIVEFSRQDNVRQMKRLILAPFETATDKERHDG